MDARIPLLFARPADPLPAETAVVVEGHAADFPGAAAIVRVTPRAAGLARCACCAPRHQIAQALAKLFFARARGEVAFFRQVVVIGPDETAIRAAVADDVVTAARYRIASSG